MMLPEDLSGKTFGRDGRYRIEKKLGDGGFGVVFRAFDVPNNRTVALKFLRTEGTADPDVIARFKNEGRRCAALVHPNLVRIYHAGREDGRLFIASEYIEGSNLYQLLVKAGQPFSVDRALQVIADAARGLKEAHRMGVVHRDLKPENIMIRDADQVVKVLDFGIAKDLHDSVGRTRAGAFIGTVGYASPEQVNGYAVDERTDIFSLGAILYELLTRKAPFPAKRTTEAVKETLKHDPVPASSLNPSVAVPVTGLIASMMRKTPDKRLASCDAVIERIEVIRAALKA
jgi:serine/threonine-protein kinase